jgi:uncharacterized surface protein with fasciclin (FAS1) repeats
MAMRSKVFIAVVVTAIFIGVYSAPVYAQSTDPAQTPSTDPVPTPAVDPAQKHATDPVQKPATDETMSDPASTESTTPSQTPASDPAATQSTQASASGSMAKQDIVATAMAAGNFTILAKALQAAGLVDTLKGAGPYTVFAPTDDAFNKLPAGALDALLKDPAKLKKVLLYHVVQGNVTSDQVMKMKEAKTVEGSSADVMVHDGKVMIDKSMVTTPDIAASNGVIHVIDTVLMP